MGQAFWLVTQAGVHQGSQGAQSHCDSWAGGAGSGAGSGADRLLRLHAATCKAVTLPLHEVCDFQALFSSRLQLRVGGPWQEQSVVCQVVVPVYDVPQVCVSLHSSNKHVSGSTGLCQASLVGVYGGPT